MYTTLQVTVWGEGDLRRCAADPRLLALTDPGVGAITEILRRERAHGRTHLGDLDEQRLRDAALTLADVRCRL